MTSEKEIIKILDRRNSGTLDEEDKKVLNDKFLKWLEDQEDGKS